MLGGNGLNKETDATRGQAGYFGWTVELSDTVYRQHVFRPISGSIKDRKANIFDPFPIHRAMQPKVCHLSAIF
jgi:hypothetical protein